MVTTPISPLLQKVFVEIRVFFVDDNGVGIRLILEASAARSPDTGPTYF